jgi:hypothetical protein
MPLCISFKEPNLTKESLLLEVETHEKNGHTEQVGSIFLISLFVNQDRTISICDFMEVARLPAFPCMSTTPHAFIL